MKNTKIIFAPRLLSYNIQTKTMLLDKLWRKYILNQNSSTLKSQTSKSVHNCYIKPTFLMSRNYMTSNLMWYLTEQIVYLIEQSSKLLKTLMVFYNLLQSWALIVNITVHIRLMNCQVDFKQTNGMTCNIGKNWRRSLDITLCDWRIIRTTNWGKKCEMRECDKRKVL